MKEFLITEKESAQRLDKYLQKCLRKAPKSFLYKMLRKKNITLNGKKAQGNELLSSGDRVTFFLSDETFSGFQEDTPAPASSPGRKEPLTRLQVIYEDAQVLLINKPAGIASQPDRRGEPSMVEAVTSYLLSSGALSEQDLAFFRPSVVNRLDINTSGILMAGKTLSGLQDLSLLIREHALKKVYLAICHGVLREELLLTGYLVKDEKKNRSYVLKEPAPHSYYIETRVCPIKDNGSQTLVEVHLVTGRPHQIRAHLASIAHPLLGDAKYNHIPESMELSASLGLKTQLLHASSLTFPKDCARLTSIAGRTFTAPVPDRFRSIANKLGL